MRPRRSASSTSDECTTLRRSSRFIHQNESLQVENASNAKPQVESTRGHEPFKGTKHARSKLKEGFENVGVDEEVNKCKKIGLRSGSSTTCSVLALPTAQKERGDEYEVQRKGNQCEVLNTSSKEWTKEEEAALQRAYLAAKPTPHFWKKVAKLVPGKSAQECFDKIHSDHLTPTQPKTRAKMSRKAASPIEQSPLSASKVLNSPDPTMRKPNRRKSKGHLVHKTLRQLLQRHSIVDENYQADLFSVLEPGIDPSTKAFQSDTTMSTPVNSNKKRTHLQELREGSLSGHKKPLSRFHSSLGATLTSPPVLKEIKNRFLHEKYLDQLHSREAKRISSQVGKAFIEGNKAQHDDRRDTVKAAKNALALDLNDAINPLRHLRDDALSNSAGFDEDCLDRGSEDTDEDIC